MELLARLRSIALACALSAVVHGCIGNSPEQAEADALGPDPSGFNNGPLHRAGFPCTRCHGDAWWQDSPAFRLAGTIYEKSTDKHGLNNAEVIVRDAAGRELNARTNQSGNFYFVDESIAFPIRVSVRSGDHEQTMRSLIWRERSCATCHRGEPGADNNGQIFVTEVSP